MVCRVRLFRFKVLNISTVVFVVLLHPGLHPGVLENINSPFLYISISFFTK